MTRVWAAGLAAAASVSLMSVGGRAVDPPATPATTNTQPVAPYRTANFVILAPTSEVARAIGEAAEAQRAAVARRWFGDDPAPWPRPCTIRVDLALGPSGGSTTYEFTPGSDGHPAVGFASMGLRGELRPLLASCLPHELTHLVMAHHFGKPLPRWADEGLAMQAESASNQATHDARCRDLLNEGRGIRLRILFRMMDYPPDLMAVYTQGHSVVRFLSPTPPGGFTCNLVARAGSARFLHFLRVGVDANTAESWDRAAKEVYSFDSVDALEEAWLGWLKTRGSVLAPGAADRSIAPLAKQVPADMIPPIELPGSGQPTRPKD